MSIEVRTVSIRVPEDAGGLYERISYPAGELQVRLKPTTVRAIYEASRVRIVCQLAHLNLMELALLVEATTRVAEFKKVQLVLPYLPYARADRRFVDGDCHGLHVFGSILNTMLVDEVVTLDVHSNKAQQHINRLRNVAPDGFIKRALDEVYYISKGWPMVLLPDEGSLTRYAYLDQLCDIPVVHATKVRDAKTGQLSGFKVPDVVNNHVLIVDDICDGGGTFIGIAEKLPKDVKKYLYVTHGIFSKGILSLLDQFEHIYTTNSYPTKSWYPGDRVTTYNALELL